MAANATERQQRAEALRLQLSSLQHAFIDMDCGTEGCRGQRRYSLRELGGFYGANLSLAGLLRRMRCQACSRPAAIASLIVPIGRYGGPEHTIRLEGPGAAR